MVLEHTPKIKKKDTLSKGGNNGRDFEVVKNVKQNASTVQVKIKDHPRW
jgi:hypothetical protein